MANEITITSQASLRNGGLEHTYKPAAVNVDQAAEGISSQVLNIGTSEVALSFGDISTEGFAYFKNLDDTNYVQWGPESAGAMVPVGRLKPSEPATLLRLEPGAVIRMQANAAACKVLVTVFEN